MERVIITHEALKNEYNKVKTHCEELVNSAQTLFDNRNYVISTAISVIAQEEVAKIHLIVEHIRSGKPIYENEWVATKKHKFKLTNPLKKLSARVRKIEPEKLAEIEKTFSSLSLNLRQVIPEIMKNEESILVMLKKFDDLKKNCFYIDERKNELFSLVTLLNENEQKALSFWSLNNAKLKFHGALIYLDWNAQLLSDLKLDLQQTNDPPLDKLYQQGLEIFYNYYSRKY